MAAQAWSRSLAAGAAILALLAVSAYAKVDFKYHEYPALTELLQNFSTTYPQITQLFSIGQSVEGRELWVLRITDQPTVEEVGEPKFKYIGNIHGDEKVGREVLIHYIDWLLSNYGRDATLTELIDTTDIYILPSLNPDGALAGRRSNARGVDLNRNYPDEFIDPQDSTAGRQPETVAVMNWLQETPFVLSAQLHGGTLVVNYPRSANDSSTPSPYYAAAPDDAFFREASTAYAKAHPTMSQSVQFPGGITNGAMWYVIYGGMQDFNYLYRGCLEVTVELSNPKTPPESQLESYWDANRASLLAYNQQVHRGVKGTVTDAASGAPVRATITVRDNAYLIQSDVERQGRYFRLLPAGTFELTFEAAGYQPSSYTVNTRSAGENAVVLDVKLARL